MQHDVLTMAPRMVEVDFAYSPLEDLDDRLAQLRHEGHRLVRVTFKGEPAFLVLQYKDNVEGLSDDRNIPASTEYIREWDTQGATVLKLDGDEHRAHRKVMEEPFKASEIRRLVDQLLVPLADELIDAFGNRRALDLQHSFTRLFPFRVMSRMLGVPAENEDELVPLIGELVQGSRFQGEDGDVEKRRQRCLEAVARANAYLRPIVEERRRAPKDDIISLLLAARIDGEPLDETTLYDYIRFMFPAGADTTQYALALMLITILSDQSLVEELVQNPAKRAAAVDESLRYATPAALKERILIRDALVCGVRLPADSVVLYALASGNRDSSVFPEPDVFALDQRRKPLLSFGIGAHHCLGVHLAKQEMLVALDRLLDRLPGLRLVGEPPRATGGIVRMVPHVNVAFDELLPPP